MSIPKSTQNQKSKNQKPHLKKLHPWQRNPPDNLNSPPENLQSPYISTTSHQDYDQDGGRFRGYQSHEEGASWWAHSTFVRLESQNSGFQQSLEFCFIFVCRDRSRVGCSKFAKKAHYSRFFFCRWWRFVAERCGFWVHIGSRSRLCKL